MENNEEAMCKIPLSMLVEVYGLGFLIKFENRHSVLFEIW